MPEPSHAVNVSLLRILKRRVRDDRGAVAAFVVLALPVFLAATGVVVDVGYVFGVRAALQSAADLGALAAAQNVDLEALAQGERRILEAQARSDGFYWVRRNLEAHPLTQRHAEDADVEVRVYNGHPERPLRHPWTGRVLTDPTVSVRILAEVPLFFARSVARQVSLTVTADASLLEKADPLPYD